MSAAHQIEPISTEHLLKCLGLAVDEAKYARQLITTKEMVDSLGAEKPFTQRVTHLNREIAYLELKLEEVRTKAGANK